MRWLISMFYNFSPSLWIPATFFMISAVCAIISGNAIMGIVAIECLVYVVVFHLYYYLACKKVPYFTVTPAFPGSKKLWINQAPWKRNQKLCTKQAFVCSLEDLMDYLPVGSHCYIYTHENFLLRLPMDKIKNIEIKRGGIINLNLMKRHLKNAMCSSCKKKCSYKKKGREKVLGFCVKLIL